MSSNGHLTYTTDDDVIEALFKCGGNISKAAKMLKLTNIGEFRKRIEKDEVLKQAVMESREQLLDRAEERIIKGMTKADAKWILERKGRNRGWGTVVANANLNLNVDEYDLSQYPLEERIRLLEMLNGTNSGATNNHPE